MSGTNEKSATPATEHRANFERNVERLVKELGGKADRANWRVDIEQENSFRLTLLLDLQECVEHEVVPARAVNDSWDVHEKKRDAERARDDAKAEVRSRLASPREALETRCNLEKIAPGGIFSELADQHIFDRRPVALVRNCGACRGKGVKRCPTCGGKGKIERQVSETKLEQQTVEMPGGTGFYPQVGRGAGGTPIGVKPVQKNTVRSIKRKCRTCNGSKKQSCGDCAAQGRVADVVRVRIITKAKWTQGDTKALRPKVRQFVKRNRDKIHEVCPVGSRDINERAKGVDLNFKFLVPHLKGTFAFYDADGARHEFEAQAMGTCHVFEEVDAVVDRIVKKEIDSLKSKSPAEAVRDAANRPAVGRIVQDGKEATKTFQRALSASGIKMVHRFLARQRTRLAAKPFVFGASALLLAFGAAAAIAANGGEQAFGNALVGSFVALAVCWIGSTWGAGRGVRPYLNDNAIKHLRKKTHLWWVGLSVGAFVPFAATLEQIAGVG